MAILDIVKKIFTTKKDNNMSDQTTPPIKRKHKLEIQVYEADYENADRNNGMPQWRPVRSDPTLDGGRPNIIEVVDTAEFNEIQKQYAMCDQKIKVIREIDPFPFEDQASSKAPNIPTNSRAIPSAIPMTTSGPVTSGIASAQTQEVTIPAPIQDIAAMPKQKQKPKIVVIGDIEVKYDGDKVYQKQWMKLTPSEASNFRIVNDSNNKTISMSGKRIEAKRWVLIEENNGAENDDVVDNLIGEN